MDVLQTRVAATADWLFAPDWLTPEEAYFLSGWDKDILLEIITEDSVDLNDEGLTRSGASFVLIYRSPNDICRCSIDLKPA
jgi:hypothetical protein